MLSIRDLVARRISLPMGLGSRIKGGFSQHSHANGILREREEDRGDQGPQGSSVEEREKGPAGCLSQLRHQGHQNPRQAVSGPRFRTIYGFHLSSTDPSCRTGACSRASGCPSTGNNRAARPSETCYTVKQRQYGATYYSVRGDPVLCYRSPSA